MRHLASMRPRATPHSYHLAMSASPTRTSRRVPQRGHITVTAQPFISDIEGGALTTQLAAKAPQATTYTKTEVDNIAAAKANQSSAYTKTEVDTIADTKQAILCVNGLVQGTYLPLSKFTFANSNVAVGATSGQLVVTAQPDYTEVVGLPAQLSLKAP